MAILWEIVVRSEERLGSATVMQTKTMREKRAKNVRLGQRERQRQEEEGWSADALPRREGRAETFSRSTQCLLDTIDPASTETGCQARRNTGSHTDKQPSCRLYNQLINSDHLYAARQFMHFVKVLKRLSTIFHFTIWINNYDTTHSCCRIKVKYSTKQAFHSKFKVIFSGHNGLVSND